MKGKKSDTQFISDFITRSVVSGFDSPDKIIEYAKILINNIDKEIKEIDQKKLTRSKLLDVIASFEKPVKPTKVIEAKILSFFQIQKPKICKYICNILKDNVVSTEDIMSKSFPKEDIIFCIKQLLEQKIIAKIDNQLLRGAAFEDYCKFVLREGL